MKKRNPFNKQRTNLSNRRRIRGSFDCITRLLTLTNVASEEIYQEEVRANSDDQLDS